MHAFFEEVAVILGATPPLTKTDREIIETMIELGAEPAEIAETFGYAPAQIEALSETPECPGGPDLVVPLMSRNKVRVVE